VRWAGFCTLRPGCPAALDAAGTSDARQRYDQLQNLASEQKSGSDVDGRVRRTGLWIVTLVHMAVYWYPLSLDLPKRIDNTAVHLANGTWALDDTSRVTIRLPDALPDGAYSITIEAQPAKLHQGGPARLVSAGTDPYHASFMIGFDYGDVVVRLPCNEGNSDAEWRVASGNGTDLSIRLWLNGHDAASRPMLMVNGQAPRELEAQCGGDHQAVPALLTMPWTLGNVKSGHRPFSGRITRLELASGDRSIDLLREAIPETPTSFWIWPERLYQPESDEQQQTLATLWHFLGFLAFGYLLASGAAAPAAGWSMLIATFFSGILFVGKIFMAARHPSVVDLLANMAGAATGILASGLIRRKLFV
jgi:VanZ family protein